MSRAKRVYYSVDVEASGPVPGLYNLLSIGTTVVRPEGGQWVVGETQYLELRPVFAGHLASANAVHGLDLDRLQKEGLEPRQAMQDLTDFVESTRDGAEAVFVGHVAVFDWMHVAWYFAWSGLPNPFGYKGIDTKSLAMGVLRVGWNETSREQLADALGVPAQEGKTLHRADADAEHQAHLLAAMLRKLELAD